MSKLSQTDPVIAKLIREEQKRQKETLMMIPSENTASRAVEEAVGSVLANKYAEGYPHRRYYQGQHVVDQVEDIAIERAKALFGVPYVNVQPYSGSPANLAVLSALLNPQDVIMGLSLASGGHLTHGASASMTSHFFRSISYDVTPHGFIDYDAILRLAQKEKPKMIIAGTTAYARILDWKKFRAIADSVGAFLMADISHIAGLIVGGVYPSPVPFVDIVTTTTHKTLRGPRGAIIMVTDRGLRTDSSMPDRIAKAVFPGLQGGPHMNTIAGIAVALHEARTASFKKYAAHIIQNAKALADTLQKRGLTIVTGGTDSHVLLIDMRSHHLLGNTVAEAAESAHIIFNRNAIPFDPNPPFYPSGIRLGTPGITSRGMKESQMKKIGNLLVDMIEALQITKEKLAITDEMERKKENRRLLIAKTHIIPKIRKEIIALTKRFPNKSV